MSLHARLVLGTALILPWPALADSLSLSSHVTAVTVYPQAAEITREVAFQADKAGTFDLVIPDLPPDAESQGLHFAGSAGLTIGAFALRTDRVPPATPVDSPAVTAARAGLKSAEAALTQAEAARDSILAKAEAATAQVSFLAAIKIDGASLTPDALLALTGAVGAQVLAARQAAIAARTEAAPATEAVTAAQKARDAAQAALDALTATPEDRAALTLTVDVATPGPVTLAITHFVQDASWVPVYELALDDKAATPGLTLDRGAQVAQDTGEDWTGVALTLSTARPGDQSAPTALYPLLRSIGDPEPPVDERAVADGMAMAPPAEPAPVTTAAPTMTTAGADFQGVAVTYHLAQPVSVATGAEDLRLTLDSLAFPATVLAQAVPSRDATAFVVANWVNTGKEVLLPGDMLTLRDGTLVGGGSLPMLAPGDKTTTGFGALDGVKLKREVPDRSTGDHGVFTTSTEQHETAVLSAENLTDQPWKVRMLDQVPYSEQDDLKIDWSADPKPSETDVEGARGILAWTFDLAPGAKQQVTLTTKLNWPSGKVLQ